MHKAIVVVALVVGVLVGAAGTLLVVRSWSPTALADGDPHAGASFCMDANGDGMVNIADAVFTLGYLFLGEPASVDCSTPPHEAPHLLAQIAALEAEIALLQAELARRVSLPATGQTKCYSNLDEINCGSGDFPGQDAFYQAGCSSQGRFVNNRDGSVTDTCTGLMWQKDTADVSGNGSIGADDRLNWQDALKYCEGLSFAGHDDWRLPNVRELQSIVDYGRRDPTIDPVFGAVSGFYWSSSSDVGHPGYALGVGFDRGFVNGGVGEGIFSYCRGVRGGL